MTNNKPNSIIHKEKYFCSFCEVEVKVTTVGSEDGVKFIRTLCEMCKGNYLIYEVTPPKCSEQEAGLKFNKITVPPPDHKRPKGQGKIKVLDAIEGLI